MTLPVLQRRNYAEGKWSDSASEPWSCPLNPSLYHFRARLPIHRCSSAGPAGHGRPRLPTHLLFGQLGQALTHGRTLLLAHGGHIPRLGQWSSEAKPYTFMFWKGESWKKGGNTSQKSRHEASMNSFHKSLSILPPHCQVLCWALGWRTENVMSLPWGPISSFWPSSQFRKCFFKELEHPVGGQGRPPFSHSSGRCRVSWFTGSSWGPSTGTLPF